MGRALKPLSDRSISDILQRHSNTVIPVSERAKLSPVLDRPLFQRLFIGEIRLYKGTRR